jgi:hypothetical protein
VNTDRELKPRAIDAADPFDYEIRAAVLKLLREKLTGPRHWVEADIDDMLASPRLRELLDCLASMAVAGFLEYYHGDDEWAESTIFREIGVAEDLQDAEAKLFPESIVPPED